MLTKITEQDFVKVLVELRTAYREYRSLSWFTWLFRRQAERVARERLNAAVKEAGYVYVYCDLTNAQSKLILDAYGEAVSF